MALIVETGDIVSGAQTYGVYTGLTAFATARGVTGLPAGETELDALLMKAMDYLQRFTGRWKGERVSDVQVLDFPRSGVYVDGVLLASDEIPSLLINAQYALAVAANTTDLLPTATANEKGLVIREKVDVIERAYAEGKRNSPVAVSQLAESYLSQLLKSAGGLRTVRV